MQASNRSRSFALMVVVVGLIWAGRGLADAPVGQYVISNGKVFDTKSQLTWEQTTSTNVFSFDEAKTHCATLALDGGGWRVPSMKELQTIVDESRVTPVADLKAFPDMLSTDYWTSTVQAFDTTSAWIVNFDWGPTSWDYQNSTHNVRCVR